MTRFAWLLLPLLSTSCLSDILGGSMGADRTSNWYETGVVRKPREELARNVKELLLRHGFQTAEFDAANERVETSWDVRLSTLWREGYRTKVEVEILPGDLGGFNVRVRSTMEINDNEKSPAIPERARWVGAGVSDKHKSRIPDTAIKINTLLKNRFFGLNP
ncbi:MAG: hypothetical protein HY293_10245 [Planctomycetes bacterium]|nr:hypothetical protein [Planctomycetota bacterium]